MVHSAQSEEAPKDRLRLVSFNVFSTYFVPHWLQIAWKDGKLESRNALPGNMERLVANGDCDLRITYQPIPQLGVEFTTAGRIRMGFFASRAMDKARFAADVHFVVPEFSVPKPGKILK